MKREEILEMCVKLAQPIEVLDLDLRAYNCLHRSYLDHIYDVALKTDDELMQVRNLGVSTLRHIREQIDRYVGSIEFDKQD